MKDNWANRAAGLKCVRCCWWIRKADHVGRCRRHAPSADAPGWPITFETDYCGDFRLAEDALSLATRDQKVAATPVPTVAETPSGLAKMTPEQQIQSIRDAKARGDVRPATREEVRGSGMEPFQDARG